MFASRDYPTDNIGAAPMSKPEALIWQELHEQAHGSKAPPAHDAPPSVRKPWRPPTKFERALDTIMLLVLATGAYYLVKFIKFAAQ
jgi:hypothetical protein